MLGLVAGLLAVGHLTDNRVATTVTWYLVENPETVVTALLLLLAISSR